MVRLRVAATRGAAMGKGAKGWTQDERGAEVDRGKRANRQRVPAMVAA